MKRYLITTEFYIVAENDNEAVEISMKIADKSRANFDNQCQVSEISKQPFGSLVSEKIYPSK